MYGMLESSGGVKGKEMNVRLGYAVLIARGRSERSHS